MTGVILLFILYNMMSAIATSGELEGSAKPKSRSLLDSTCCCPIVVHSYVIFNLLNIWGKFCCDIIIGCQ